MYSSAPGGSSERHSLLRSEENEQRLRRLRSPAMLWLLLPAKIQRHFSLLKRISKKRRSLQYENDAVCYTEALENSVGNGNLPFQRPILLRHCTGNATDQQGKLPTSPTNNTMIQTKSKRSVRYELWTSEEGDMSADGSPYTWTGRKDSRQIYGLCHSVMTWMMLFCKS